MTSYSLDNWKTIQIQIIIQIIIQKWYAAENLCAPYLSMTYCLSEIIKIGLMGHVKKCTFSYELKTLQVVRLAFYRLALRNF